MARAAYWQGIRLWEIFQTLEPWAARSTDALHQGVEQQYAVRNADSPNFARQVRVTTVVEALETQIGDAKFWVGLYTTLLDLEADLLALALDTPQGDLAIAMDDSLKVDVDSSGPYMGDDAVVGHSAAPAGWTRTVGQYVLARDPATGEGFAAPIESVDDSGTDVTIDIPSGYSLDNGWDLVYVQIVLPDCAYRVMNGGDFKELDERGVRDATFEFDCESDPLFYSGHVRSHDNG